MDLTSGKADEEDFGLESKDDMRDSNKESCSEKENENSDASDTENHIKTREHVIDSDYENEASSDNEVFVNDGNGTSDLMGNVGTNGNHSCLAEKGNESHEEDDMDDNNTVEIVDNSDCNAEDDGRWHE